MHEYEEKEKAHAAAVAAVKDDLGRQLRVKEQTLLKLHEENEHLRANFDRANRDREQSEKNLLLTAQTLEAERQSLPAASLKLGQRITEAERAERRARGDLAEEKKKNGEEKVRLENLAGELDQRRKDLDDEKHRFDQARSSIRPSITQSVVKSTNGFSFTTIDPLTLHPTLSRPTRCSIRTRWR